MCNKCGVEKPFTEFYKHKTCRDGISTECTVCASLYQKTYATRPSVKEAKKHRNKAYRNSPGGIKVSGLYRKTYSLRPDVREAQRARFLKRKYGIDVATYDRILESQNGRCAICHKKPVSERLHVDHNHVTGAVRGLLCNQCNRGLGMLHDSISALKAALTYLKKWSF